jgi:uncharacterized protein YndB with AHSA1/START domain
MTTNTDRIEKKTVLRASRSKVFRAIANAEEFGEWFRVKLDGPFKEGATIFGQITYPGYEHLKMEMFVEKLEPESYVAFRWHPHAIDVETDYSAEPMTLVEFRLEETPGGTALTVTESGFDRIPPARRAEAFRMNEGGWAAQLKNIEAYAAKYAA